MSGVWSSVSLTSFICKENGQNIDSCYGLIMLYFQCRCWRTLTKWYFFDNWRFIQNQPQASIWLQVSFKSYLFSSWMTSKGWWWFDEYISRLFSSFIFSFQFWQPVEKSWLPAAKTGVPSAPEEVSNEGYGNFPRLQVKLWQAEVFSFLLRASRHLFPGW